MDLKPFIREVPDFPKKGVNFKDVSTLLREGKALRYAVDTIAAHFAAANVELVVGTESRGFLIGAPLAYSMNVGMALVRKPGKLPCRVERVEYELEYGTDALEIHYDAVEPGQRVLIVDDVLATGGTMAATAHLVKKLGGHIVGFAFLIELDALKGRERLGDIDVMSLVHY